LFLVDEILGLYETDLHNSKSFWIEVKEDLSKDIKPSKVVRVRKPDEFGAM
jgi:hypothetical protein